MDKCLGPWSPNVGALSVMARQEGDMGWWCARVADASMGWVVDISYAALSERVRRIEGGLAGDGSGGEEGGCVGQEGAGPDG